MAAAFSPGSSEFALGFLDVTSQARYQEGMCHEFEQLLQNGNLYCNRDIDPVFGPDGKTHTNKCVMCREVLLPFPAEKKMHKKDGDCSEYWPYFTNGGFSCTRENNPIRDASGKQHNNKCIMCLQRFKNGGKMNSVEKNQPQNGNNEEADECNQYRSLIRPDGELYCTRENDPVRDASGRTHSNKCMMCAEKFKKEAREGKIAGGGGGRGQSPNANGNRITQGSPSQGDKNEKNCNEHDGSLQRNYGINPCTVNQQIAQGDYRSHTNCGGTGESTYYNEKCQGGRFSNRQKRKAAKLDCSGTLSAPKKKGTSCSDLWSPVCGTDGKTYRNKCFLCSEIMKAEDFLTLKHEGECPEVVQGMVNCSKYPQTKGRVLCRTSAREVCGTDGQTYRNECMLCNKILKTKSEIGIKNIGPCPKVSTFQLILYTTGTSH
ncbi:Serine protease inhibitor Kazal-type 5 [Varanus komodoensis]|nr:Serine protease inhibitor Kazal-type 5 [Varanus komodoensis]